MKRKTTTARKKSEAVNAEVIHVEPGQPAAHLPALQNTPDQLIALAIQHGNISIDVLERLSRLQQEWLDRQAKSLFLEAKSKFQSEVPVLRKTKNVHYDAKSEGGQAVDYYFAPLGKIAAALQPLLVKHGLTYDWKPQDITDDKGVPKIRVSFILSHVAGHSEATTMEAYHDSSGGKTPIKARASAFSYLQRYTLIGGLGLSTDDVDDDGGAANKRQAEGEAKGNKGTPDKPTISTEQLNKAVFRISKGEDILDEVRRHYTLDQKAKDALDAAEQVRLLKADESQKKKPQQ